MLKRTNFQEMFTNRILNGPQGHVKSFVPLLAKSLPFLTSLAYEFGSLALVQACLGSIGW